MNWPTIIIAAIVLIVFLAIVISTVRNKKLGKGACSSCGGSCGGCSLQGQCHSAGAAAPLPELEQRI